MEKSSIGSIHLCARLVCSAAHLFSLSTKQILLRPSNIHRFLSSIMRFGSIFGVAAAVLAPVVSGIITGIAVPDTIKTGEGFNLRITTANYIQSVYDVSVAVGIAPGHGFPGSLGQVLGSYYLGPGKPHESPGCFRLVADSRCVNKNNPIYSPISPNGSRSPQLSARVQSRLLLPSQASGAQLPIRRSTPTMFLSTLATIPAITMSPVSRVRVVGLAAGAECIMRTVNSWHYSILFIECIN